MKNITDDIDYSIARTLDHPLWLSVMGYHTIVTPVWGNTMIRVHDCVTRIYQDELGDR